MPVKQKRTGWREQQISERHRQWGFNCPAVDLDFLLVEYNIGKPVAVVEYKRYGALEPNLKHPTYRALSELANGAKIPFIIVFYWPKIWAFQAYPVNKYAKEHFVWGEKFSEDGFVKKLYQLRQCVLLKAIEYKLNKECPPANSDYSLNVDDDSPFS